MTLIGAIEYQTLHEAIAGATLRHPDRIAVADETSSLTYRELDLRAATLARHLTAEGVQRSLVGLCARRGVDLIAGILGILRTGSAYVPLDPGLPPERLSFLVDDCEAVAILADSSSAPGLPAIVPVIPIDPEGDGPDAPDIAVAGDDLAYVIYTSGTTGAPKGVMVEHRQVLELFAATEDLFHFGPDDVWSAIHSPSFDFSVWEIFGALLYGGCVVVASEPTVRSPDALWRLIARESVTRLSVTPSYFTQLSAADRHGGADVRSVFFGGEALDASALTPWFERYGTTGPELVNMYGITEITVHATYHTVTPQEAATGRSSIGVPLRHLRIRLLDEDQHPVPTGDVGEIYVSGSGLARGYLNRAELSAERFVSIDAERYYRSGDLGRANMNGELEYLGRTDEQVKVRGYRVELGEIEHALLRHPDVAAVAVVSYRGKETGIRLAAYVVAPSGAKAPEAAPLREFLSRILPAYMIPSLFTVLDRLPLSHNGKLDRAALSDPGTIATRPAAYARSPTAAKLLHIWREMLEDAGITSDSRFYNVGGDSIQAIRIAAAARRAGVQVEIEDLLANPTVNTLAGLLGGRSDSLQEPHTAVGGLIGDQDRDAIGDMAVDAYPLTSLQMGMLYHAQATVPAPYHSVSAATVRLAFDAVRFAECVGGAVDRNEALRTWFDLDGFSVPLQRVAASAEPRLRVVDVRPVPSQERAAAVEQVIAEERSRPLDHGVAPMCRFTVVVTGSGDFVLIWSEHHAILDGWSSNSLFAQIVAEYAGLAAEEEDDSVPPLRDYVAAEQAAVASPRQRAFWSGYLHGLPAAEPTSEDGDGIELGLDLPVGTYDRLVASAALAGASPKSLFMAPVAVGLGIMRQTSEVVLGHAAHGRLTRPGAERALGLFLNTLPLRVPTSGTWRDVCTAVSAALLEIGPYQRYPLAYIQRAAGIRLDNLVNFTRFAPVERLTEQGLVGNDGVRNYAWTNFPLLVDATCTPARELCVTLQFRGPYWPAGARTEFADLLRDLLLQAVNGLDRLARPESSGVLEAPREPASPADRGPVIEDDMIEDDTADPRIPLSGPYDQIVAEVWQAVLGIAPSYRSDRFSDLGGDSLAAIRAVAGYAKQGVKVRAVELLRHSAVSEQAALVASRRA